jgi:hypothetical protein
VKEINVIFNDNLLEFSKLTNNEFSIGDIDNIKNHLKSIDINNLLDKSYKRDYFKKEDFYIYRFNKYRIVYGIIMNGQNEYITVIDIIKNYERLFK